MRELSEHEVDEICGGNSLLVAGATAGMNLTSAFGAGYMFGQGINYFNSTVSGMSLGLAIWRTTN